MFELLSLSLPRSAYFLCAGLSSSSVQWGAWASIGMVADNAAVHRAMQRSGVGMLDPCQGLAAMQQVLGAAAGQAVAQLAAIPFVWQRFMQQQRNAAAFFYGEHKLEEVQHRPQLALLSGSQPATQQHKAAAVSPLEHLLAQVLAALAAVHGSSIDPQQPLVQAGLDSLGECLLAGLRLDHCLHMCAGHGSRLTHKHQQAHCHLVLCPSCCRRGGAAQHPAATAWRAAAWHPGV